MKKLIAISFLLFATAATQHAYADRCDIVVCSKDGTVPKLPKVKNITRSSVSTNIVDEDNIEFCRVTCVKDSSQYNFVRNPITVFNQCPTTCFGYNVSDSGYIGDGMSNGQIVFTPIGGLRNSCVTGCYTDNGTALPTAPLGGGGQCPTNPTGENSTVGCNDDGTPKPPPPPSFGQGG